MEFENKISHMEEVNAEKEINTSYAHLSDPEPYDNEESDYASDIGTPPTSPYSPKEEIYFVSEESDGNSPMESMKSIETDVSKDIDPIIMIDISNQEILNNILSVEENCGVGAITQLFSNKSEQSNEEEQPCQKADDLLNYWTYLKWVCVGMLPVGIYWLFA